MIHTIFREATKFFSVPPIEENADLIRAQFEVFSRQIPLMYSVLLINAWILVVSFWTSAPLWLTLLCPLIFTSISVKRLLGWLNDRHVVPDIELARNRLISTNRVAFILAVFLVSWALALYPYGDLGQRAHIAFFMAVTGICVVMCLMHLRSAAFIVWLVISVAFFGHFVMSGEGSFVAMAINMPFASIALLLMVYVQSKHFTNSVAARSRLEAVSLENLQLANTDKLTGLPNRRKFFAQLTASLQEAKVSGQRVAVAIVDMDGFKSVNDLYGHAAGDTLLSAAGHRLSALATTDMFVSRLGGDEFAVIIQGRFDDQALLNMGRSMSARLGEPFEVSEAVITLSASIGIAVYPDVADSPKTLYERADYAHYECKRNQRGTASLFSKAQISTIEDRKRIEAVLLGADHKAEIFPYFQPIFDVTTGHLSAFEALSRWQSPELGLVSPGAFITAAERTGLINNITRIVLEKSLAIASNWPGEIRLSFNLSAHDVGNLEAIHQIVDIVNASGLDPRRLDFEITETAFIGDLERAKASMEVLIELGCGIALDDFGTGYSSLSQLHSLPLSKIKIDRSFVSDIETTPASLKIVKSLLTLSHDMGLSCIVEGVETEAERSVIERLGGTLVQGFYFSKPIPAVEIQPFLDRLSVETCELVA